MKSVLVIGLGRFGRSAVKKLYELGHEVLAVDWTEERVNNVLQYTTEAMIGDSTSVDFLKSLGIDNFDLCIVAIGDNFEHSVITTYHLRELGAKKIVARAARETHKKFLLHNGADEVVYPEKQLAEWTAIRYSQDHIFDYIKLDNTNAIFEIEIPKAWVNSTLLQLDVRKKWGINVIAVRRDGRVEMEIDPKMVLTDDMSLFVAGNSKNIKKMLNK
ncbi:MAG: TrkA family potassium uptake protein [Lachnospiraceae bacterium]|nr:TrkA family potassium uptake protein [Lachnospiraceae bacterium]